MKSIQKKGQLSLGAAPGIVLIIGLVFLVMATVALVGQKYGNSFPSDKSIKYANETISVADFTAGNSKHQLSGASLCNSENFALINVTNATINLELQIGAGNYSFNSVTGVLTNLTSAAGGWNITYTNDYSGVACDITGDLQTEIGNNTSIAGIILTISLVGIVLSILIGVFISVGRRTRI